MFIAVTLSFYQNLLVNVVYIISWSNIQKNKIDPPRYLGNAVGAEDKRAALPRFFAAIGPILGGSEPGSLACKRLIYFNLEAPGQRVFAEIPAAISRNWEKPSNTRKTVGHMYGRLC